MGTLEPFNRLVRLAARAFYDDVTMKGDNQPKTGRGDNRGSGRRRPRRPHQPAKGAKIYSVAAAAAGDGQPVTKEGEEKVKTQTHSYCCLDYAQIYDVVRYRLHRMRKKLKDELDSTNTIQQYICPNCKRRYSAFDALQLVSLTAEYFHYENCTGELVAESDKLSAEEMGDGDDNARKRRSEKLNKMLQKIEVQLKPLVAQLERIKDLPVPEFESLQSWERANTVVHANGDSGTADSSRNLRVEGAFSGVGAKEEDAGSDTEATTSKVLPPWMIKQGMNLTKEQRGEVSSTSKLDKSSEAKDDKKQDAKEDETSVQAEYIKAYYEALMKVQEEAQKKTLEENQASSSNQSFEVPFERQIGIKFKREDDDDGVKWDKELPEGNTVETYK